MILAALLAVATPKPSPTPHVTFMHVPLSVNDIIIDLASVRGKVYLQACKDPKKRYMIIAPANTQTGVDINIECHPGGSYVVHIK
jgi:hypothetical protein